MMDAMKKIEVERYAAWKNERMMSRMRVIRKLRPSKALSF
jgi:hypothetical protein